MNFSKWILGNKIFDPLPNIKNNKGLGRWIGELSAFHKIMRAWVYPQHPCIKSDMGALICNPDAWEAEIVDPWGLLSVQPYLNWVNLRSQKDSASNNKADGSWGTVPVVDLWPPYTHAQYAYTHVPPMDMHIYHPTQE